MRPAPTPPWRSTPPGPAPRPRRPGRGVRGAGVPGAGAGREPAAADRGQAARGACLRDPPVRARPTGTAEKLLEDAWSCAPQVLDGIADPAVVVPVLDLLLPASLLTEQSPHQPGPAGELAAAGRRGARMIVAGRLEEFAAKRRRRRRTPQDDAVRRCAQRCVSELAPPNGWSTTCCARLGPTCTSAPIIAEGGAGAAAGTAGLHCRRAHQRWTRPPTRPTADLAGWLAGGRDHCNAGTQAAADDDGAAAHGVGDHARRTTSAHRARRGRRSAAPPGVAVPGRRGVAALPGRPPSRSTDTVDQLPVHPRPGTS